MWVVIITWLWILLRWCCDYGEEARRAFGLGLMIVGSILMHDAGYISCQRYRLVIKVKRLIDGICVGLR